MTMMCFPRGDDFPLITYVGKTSSGFGGKEHNNEIRNQLNNKLINFKIHY
jgi:hypothetical protein